MQIPWENCRVLLYRGRGLVSSLIRWQTRSPYTHAAILMPDGRVIESREGKGVQIVEAPTVDEAEAYRVTGMTPDRWRHAIVKAQHELGSGYDWKGVLQFVSRRQGGDEHRWFCSEFVYHVLYVSGVTLLERTRAELISPGALSMSPLLERDIDALPTRKQAEAARADGGVKLDRIILECVLDGLDGSLAER